MAEKAQTEKENPRRKGGLIPMDEKIVLRMENVTMQFGGVVAVNNLSLDVPEGQIVALIGPNGAGKTTAFNCITGVYQPTNGRVSFMGKTMICSHPTGKMPLSLILNICDTSSMRILSSCRAVLPPTVNV